jgi:hypothetical protein
MYFIRTKAWKMLDVIGSSGEGGVIKQEPGISRSSRPILVRVTKLDISVDTGKRSTAVLHHNNPSLKGRSGEIESEAQRTASRWRIRPRELNLAATPEGGSGIRIRGPQPCKVDEMLRKGKAEAI